MVKRFIVAASSIEVTTRGDPRGLDGSRREPAGQHAVRADPTEEHDTISEAFRCRDPRLIDALGCDVACVDRTASLPIGTYFAEAYPTHVRR